ncbi:uncharacterized protein LOC109842610 [Asparagus officinalis]|uniref:uncharacterized protein LOC109842610 n=1 Tax=Asparagus officinalis TaxID=4686 RepID=UPI00098E49C6|nr:uncharacterized protein LOC109842610 [Asparagus officinalis]
MVSGFCLDLREKRTYTNEFSSECQLPSNISSSAQMEVQKIWIQQSSVFEAPLNMEPSKARDATLSCFAAYVACIVCAYFMLFENKREVTPREPTELRDSLRNAYIYRLFYGGRTFTYDYLRMDRGPFFNLVRMLRKSRLLKDTIYVSIEEQVAMFLHIVGHNAKNRVVGINFVRSGETISRYFNEVLVAILKLRPLLMKQASGEVSDEIRCRSTWYPWFENCIGMIDGTHIAASVPDNIVARFHGRKDGPTQNVLGVVTPNKLFCYVMAGWEGSANDFTVLRDALSMPPPKGLRLIKGTKMYFVL